MARDKGSVMRRRRRRRRRWMGWLAAARGLAARRPRHGALRTAVLCHTTVIVSTGARDHPIRAAWMSELYQVTK